MILSKFLAASALFFSAVAHAELLELHPENVEVNKDPATQQEVVGVTLTQQDKQALADYTRERVGKIVEIRVAGQRVLEPTIHGVIDNGSLWIAAGADGFQGKSAQEIADTLKQVGVMTISEQGDKPASAIGMPNPASAYCVSQGGKLEIVDEANGQVGYCTLPGGERIEEWALFRRDKPQAKDEQP